MSYLAIDKNYCGTAEELMQKIEPNSIAVSVWSPPYHVGKTMKMARAMRTGWRCFKRSLISIFRSKTRRIPGY